MHAVVREAEGVRLAEVARPKRRPGWVRIEVLLAGLCRTDLYAADGLFPLPHGEPRTLGHELVGEVLEADDDSRLERGQRVTVSPLVSCGECPACTSARRCGSPWMIGVELDGAFANELVAPEACVYLVPRDLPLKRAAYVEPVAASLAVLRAPIRPSEHGAIFGAGRIAELTARILAARGFVDVQVVSGRDVEPATFDFVIETNATADILSAALHAVRPGGVVVLKSRPPVSVSVDVTRAVLKDVTLSAVGYGSFVEAIALAGELSLDDLFGDVFELGDYATAFARAREVNGPAKLFLAPGTRKTL